MKKCCKCNNIKNLSDFQKDKNTSDGYKYHCKDCSKVYYQTNRTKILEQSKKYKKSKITQKKANLKRYKLSIEDFNSMLEIQENSCTICKTIFTEIELPCVDHCHDSKKVRSLLCRTCNLALGYFKDNPDLCFTAGTYLEIHRNLSLTNEKGCGIVGTDGKEKQNSQ